MRRVLLLCALGLIGCSAAKADPNPVPSARPRIELRTVKQNFATIIGAYVRDNNIGVQVAPGRAEDGTMRWLPIEAWAPSSTPVPRSIHSADVGLWLDKACTIGFALTPRTMLPMFVWQQKPNGYAIWQLRKPGAYTRRESKPMFSGVGPQWCVPLTDTDRDERIKGMGAWSFYERWSPESFEAYAPTETEAEASVIPVFPIIQPIPVAGCDVCIQGTAAHCGGNPARCYQPLGAQSGCCI